MKSKSIVLMAISLGFGLVAAIGISQVMGTTKESEPEAPITRPVVVATEYIDNNTKLTAENVRIEQFPLEIAPENAAETVEDVEGKVLLTRVGKDFPILLQDVVDEKEATRLPIPPGFKVSSIKVGAEGAFGGLLQPGDIIDVVGVFKIKGKDRKVRIASVTFLKKIRVFSVDSQVRPSMERGEGSKKNVIVGLLLTRKQSEQLFLVQKAATIRLNMTSQEEDGETAMDEGDNELERLLAQHENKSAPAEDSDEPEEEKDNFEMVIVTADGPTRYKFDDPGLQWRIDAVWCRYVRIG